MRKVLGVASKKNRTMGFIQWLAAYDHYSIAAVACGQISLKAAFAHRANCVKIAHMATREDRRHPLAVHYDQLVRMSWAHRSYHNEADFAIDKEVKRIDTDALARARDIFDEHNRGKGKGKGKKDTPYVPYSDWKQNGRDRAPNTRKFGNDYSGSSKRGNY